MVIELSKGHKTIIDPEDANLLGLYKWYMSSTGYAVCSVYRKGQSAKKISLHRIIIKAKNGQMVDHINGNALDNRKKNLRIVTYSQNIANTKCHKNKKYSSLKGVFYFKGRHKNKWGASIQINKKRTYLGQFETEKEAYDAYKKKHVQIFGEYSFFCRTAGGDS